MFSIIGWREFARTRFSCIGWREFARTRCTMLALTVALATTGGAQARSCSPKDADAADAAVDGLDSWNKVARAFQQYGHCDEGSIAEGNSEAIARLLVDHWGTASSLARLVRRDPALKRFILRHIDSTLDTDDLDKIQRLASASCPADSATLCSELLSASRKALR
jgi:hypothetical protein